MAEKLEVKSNVYLAGLNALLVLLTYALIIFLSHLYLKSYHGIDVVNIFMTSFIAAAPYLGNVLEFLAFLVEDLIKTSVILALLYSAYIANFKVEIVDDKLNYKQGFLWLKTDSFDIEDVEQVFTEKYAFFPNTKELCIKALDEDVIRIPYVRNADKLKKEIISRVKERHRELEVESDLRKPIKVMSWNPQ